MMPVRRAGRPLTTCPHPPGARCDCRPGAIAAAANSTPLQTARARPAGHIWDAAKTGIGSPSTAPEPAPEPTQWIGTTPRSNTGNGDPFPASSTSSYFPFDDPVPPMAALDPSLLGSMASSSSFQPSIDPYSGWATAPTSDPPQRSFSTGGTSTDIGQPTLGSYSTPTTLPSTTYSAAWSPPMDTTPPSQYASFTDLFESSAPLYEEPRTQDEEGEEGEDTWAWKDSHQSTSYHQ
ncbi:hypothetical protein B0T14DRAFT_314690 [Immersiella caudata]|uniref:Uncharacterized protein n=1 Tax=Immersiella caudata TaxID=314043 RepID=A0AA39WBV8_9PEZI|nr:hypothetical protein B0T14DRAFT_314690 [Immersiella caudata]